MARRTGSATPAVVLALALPLVGLAAFPESAREAGLDAWNVRTERAALRTAEDHGRALSTHMEEILRCRPLAEQVLDRLADGTLPLADAAAELEALYRGRELALGLRKEYPGLTTDRERFARWAVSRIRGREEEEPGRHTAALPRVETELATLYPPAD